jgi:phenylacetate-CoA ligase
MNLFRINYSIIDFFRKTKTLPLFDRLVETQWTSQDNIQKIQITALKEILIHCFNNVDYYNKLFNECSFNPEKLQDFSDLNKLPIMSKDIIRKNFNDLKASHFEKYSPRKGQTGGSTGKPLETFGDKMSRSYMWANMLRGWNSGGYNLGDEFIHLASGSLLPNASNIKAKIYNYLQNAILITSYHLDDRKLFQLVDTVKNATASYIYGYSSSVYLVAQFCKANNISLNGKIKSIFTTSDMLYKWQRNLIEEIFNAKVIDIYGCPEGGIISFECPDHNGYHYNQESVFIEITEEDENGLGKIITTPMFNYAFPFIRYDTGDVGSISDEECNCGRKLYKIKELGGRIRDFLVLEDGRYIHGAFFNHLQVFYDIPWIKEYQIIQEEINEINIKLTCIGEPIKDDLIKITNSLKKGLLPNIKINFDYSGVEYTGGGKFRLILSKVKNKWDVK